MATQFLHWGVVELSIDVNDTTQFPFVSVVIVEPCVPSFTGVRACATLAPCLLYLLEKRPNCLVVLSHRLFSLLLCARRLTRFVVSGGCR